MPILNCPSCKGEMFYPNDGETYCKHCNALAITMDGDFVSSLKAEERKANSMAKIYEAQQTGDFSGLNSIEMNIAAENIIVTTGFMIANKPISHEIDVISAECAFGMNIFKDFFAGVRDIVGGRSAAVQDTLRDCRKTAIGELRREALELKADAIIGVNLNYSEISGGGGKMLFLVASGTAVKLKGG